MRDPCITKNSLPGPCRLALLLLNGGICLQLPVRSKPVTWFFLALFNFVVAYQTDILQVIVVQSHIGV